MMLTPHHHLFTWLILLTSSLVTSFPTQSKSETSDLKGRFIHITDIHPDPFYTFKASEDHGCHKVHKKETRKKEHTAGWWGLEDR
jgi:endopolyphosphatase